jgi:rfaE bifunctional protein kinase chain/domain
MDALSALQSGHQVTALVIGDVMLDAYMVGHVNRISPEAPVPVVDVRTKESRLGGAANVVKNLLAVGANVHLATVIGDDSAGNTIESLLTKLNVGASAVLRSADRPTTVKTRVISNGQQLVRVDEEVTHDISQALEDELIAQCVTLLNQRSLTLSFLKTTTRVSSQTVSSRRSLQQPMHEASKPPLTLNSLISQVIGE